MKRKAQTNNSVKYRLFKRLSVKTSCKLFVLFILRLAQLYADLNLFKLFFVSNKTFKERR